MNFNTFVSSIEDLDRCAASSIVTEVLIEPALLAIQGTLSQAEAKQLAEAATERGLRPILVWDTLLPERDMEQLKPQLLKWDWQAYTAIRVADVGAAWWLKTHQPTLPFQLLVETGSHNKHALLGWCELLAPSLERLILSIELPQEKLIEYSQTLPVQCEVMGVGRILLFNSPRSLLAHQTEIKKSPEASHLEVSISSKDSKNRPFPLIETQHGTLMFLDKDQFILDRLSPLWEAGLHTVRLDLRHLSTKPHAAEELGKVTKELQADAATLRSEWPRKTHAPFFKVNRTTVRFSKMKSKTHTKRDESCFAEVLAIQNGDFIIARTLRPFQVDQPLTMYLPTGEKCPIAPEIQFRGIDGQLATQFVEDQLILMDWQKKTCTGALIHRQETPNHE